LTRWTNGYAAEATSGIAMDDLIALNPGQSATEGEKGAALPRKNGFG